jgi:hypothetical protein
LGIIKILAAPKIRLVGASIDYRWSLHLPISVILQ